MCGGVQTRGKGEGKGQVSNKGVCVWGGGANEGQR